MLVINRKKAKKALTLTIKRPEEKTTLPPTEIPKPMEMVKSDIVPRLKTEEYKIYGEAGSPKDAIREIYKTTAASPEVKAVQKAKGFVTSNLKKTQEKAASIIPIEAAKNALLFIGKVHRKVIKLPFDAVLNELTQRPNAYKAAMLLQKASAQETLPEHDVYDPVTKQKLVTKSEYERAKDITGGFVKDFANRMFVAEVLQGGDMKMIQGKQVGIRPKTIERKTTEKYEALKGSRYTHKTPPKLDMSAAEAKIYENTRMRFAAGKDPSVFQRSLTQEEKLIAIEKMKDLPPYLDKAAHEHAKFVTRMLKNMDIQAAEMQQIEGALLNHLRQVHNVLEAQKLYEFVEGGIKQAVVNGAPASGATVLNVIRTIFPTTVAGTFTTKTEPGTIIKPSEEALITESQRIEIPPEAFYGSSATGQAPRILTEDETKEIQDMATKHNIRFEDAQRYLGKGDKRRVFGKTTAEAPEFIEGGVYGTATQVQETRKPTQIIGEEIDPLQSYYKGEGPAAGMESYEQRAKKREQTFKQTIYSVYGRAEAKGVSMRSGVTHENTIIKMYQDAQRIAEEAGYKAGEEEGITETVKRMEEKIKETEYRGRVRLDKAEKKLEEQAFKLKGKEQIRRYREAIRQIKEIEVAARQAFMHGKKIGAIEQKEKFEDYLFNVKQRNYLRSVVNDYKTRLKKAAGEMRYMEENYQKELGGVIGGIDLQKMTEKTQYRLSRMREYFSNPDNQDQLMDVPQRKIDQLSRLDKKAWGDLTIDEAREIVETAEHIVHLNKLKRKLIVRGKLRDVKTEITKAIGNLERGTAVDKEDQGTIDLTKAEKGAPRTKGITKYFTTTHYHMDTAAMELDAGDMDGTFTRMFVAPANESLNTELRLGHQAEDYVKGSLRGNGINYRQLYKTAIKKHKIKLSSGREIVITGANRIEIMALAHNANCLKDLTNSGRNPDGTPYGGIRVRTAETRWVPINKKDLQIILQSSTPEERIAARIMLDYYKDVQSPMVDAVHQRQKGYPITMRDWYFPVSRSDFDIKIERNKNFSEAMLENAKFTKDRIAQRKPFLIGNAFDDFFRNVTQVNRYVAWVENIRNWRMIMGDGHLRNQIAKTRGQHYIDYVNRWIDDLEGFAVSGDPMDAWWNKLMKRTSTAILAQPFIMGKQACSYILAALRMPLRHLIAAALRPYPTIKKTFVEMEKYDPQARERFRGQAVTLEVGEIGMSSAVTRFWFNKKGWRNIFTLGLRAIDKQTVARIWEACRHWVKSERPDLQGDAFFEEVSRRWQNVMQTQPLFHPKDRSPLGRSKSKWTRMSTMFTTQRNTIYNGGQQARVRYKYSGRTLKDKADLLYALGIIAANAAIITAYNEKTRNIMFKKRRTWWQLGIETATGAASYVYYLGDIFNLVAGAAEHGSFGGYDYETPLTQLITNTGKGIGDLVRAGIQAYTREEYKSGKKKGEGKWLTTINSAFNKLLQPVGVALGGIPIANAKRIADGAHRFYQFAFQGKSFKEISGEEEPEQEQGLKINRKTTLKLNKKLHLGGGG